jgi:hypothetical protein
MAQYMTMKKKVSPTAAGFEPTKEFPRGLHDVFKSAALTTRPDSRFCVFGSPKIVAINILKYFCILSILAF